MKLLLLLGRSFACRYVRSCHQSVYRSHEELRRVGVDLGEKWVDFSIIRCPLTEDSQWGGLFIGTEPRTDSVNRQQFLKSASFCSCSCCSRWRACVYSFCYDFVFVGNLKSPLGGLPNLPMDLQLLRCENNLFSWVIAQQQRKVIEHSVGSHPLKYVVSSGVFSVTSVDVYLVFHLSSACHVSVQPSDLFRVLHFKLFNIC